MDQFSHKGKEREEGPSPAEALAFFASVEKRFSRIYFVFSHLFSEEPELKAFWKKMGEQEEIHSTILEMAREGCIEGSPPAQLPLTRRVQSAIEARLNEYEKRLEGGDLSLKEAWEIAVAIETSEIDAVFDLLLSAVAALSVQTSPQLYETVRDHREFFAQGVRRFSGEPELIKKFVKC